MKKLFLILTLSVLLVNCGGGGEHAGITNDFINAMANEDAEGLKNLFPESHRPLSDFSNFINYMKNKKFIRKGLKGWKNIKAKGYISTGDNIDIILTDEKGTYFIYHGLRIKKDENNTSYDIANDDIHVFESKDEITNKFLKHGGKPDQIHWF